MNHDEAKFILRAYRPNGQDTDDPQFAEALAHARRDPELAKWLAEQTAFDAVISAKLQSVPVPRDLKATILAGRKVIPVRPQPWWRRSLHPAAVAAALAITFGTIGLFAFHEPPEARADFTRFTEDLTDYLSKGYGVLPKHGDLASTDHSYFGATNYRMNFRSSDLEEVRSWLKDNGGHDNFIHPGGMRKPMSFACGVMDWWGRRITVVSYQIGRNLPADKVHLVIINSGDLPDPPKRGEPRFGSHEEWNTAAWNDGRLTYFLMSPGDRLILGKYL